MTGTEPNESTADRKRNTSLVSGEFGGAVLTLGLAPERIDWLLTAAENIDPSLAMKDIGPMTESVDLLSPLVERWLATDIPDVARLAFGAVLLHPEADVAACYRRLPDYVPVAIEPDWRDFNFQVNVRSSLQIAEYGIDYLNRLSKWSVVGRNLSRFAMTEQGIAPLGTGTIQHAVRLELDINTPAESVAAISRPHLLNLFRESVAAGRAIASDGVAHEQYRLP
jgi:hypothetical protein